MTAMDRAEVLRSELTDYLGEAMEAVTNAAKHASELSTTLKLVGDDYTAESREAASWAGRLAGVISENLSQVLGEVEGEDADEVTDDDVKSVTLTRAEIREVSKALQFLQQLDSDQFDAEKLAEASLTFQLAS